MKTQKKNKKWYFDIIYGAFIGILNGFLGSGGGIIAVPLLERVKNLTPKKAHATSIALILPLSMVSGLLYAFEFKLDLLTLVLLSTGATVGGVIGSIFLKNFATSIVRIIFAVIMLVAGVKMFF